MALLAASPCVAYTLRCTQASSAAHLARSATSCPPPQLPSTAPLALHSRSLHVELGGSAMAATLFASLASADSAIAAQEMMSLAADDSRGLALLLPLIPALAWVLFNILQPALNQLDRMRGAKGLAGALGLGAAGALMLPSPADAAAQEIASLAADSDSRGVLLLAVLAPAVAWVLFNILKPALNQLDKMKAAKGFAAGLGVSAALLMAMPQAADAVEASSDPRGLLLAASLVPAIGWVLFNILQPALNQLDKMRASKSIAAAAGLGAAASLLFPLRSNAVEEISTIAAADNDSRGILLLGVLIPAIAWVLFNILQPAINQLDKMRAQK